MIFSRLAALRGRRAGKRLEGPDDVAADRRLEWLVVGLGNPGKQYERTRHNVGAEAVSELASRAGERFTVDTKRQAQVARLPNVLLAIPTTYMNDSGIAVRKLSDYYGFDDPGRIVIVHDELDLEPGVVRLKQGGGLAGHNGLRSITQHLKTQDYLRVRIGVGKPPSKEHGAGHVLNRVPRRDRELLDVAVQVAADAVDAIVESGITAAMQRFHSRS